MGDDQQYFWVVLCKNHKFHKRQNLLFGHKIPLAETDPYMPCPQLEDGVNVRCHDCGHEYCYKPDEVVRVEAHPHEFGLFHPHPLFA
jgi:Zn ribbon nucleic-acid-binding protein